MKTNSTVMTPIRQRQRAVEGKPREKRKPFLDRKSIDIKHSSQFEGVNVSHEQVVKEIIRSYAYNTKLISKAIIVIELQLFSNPKYESFNESGF